MIGTNVDLGLGLRNSDYIERRWVGAKLLSATGLAHVYREEVGNVEKRNDVRTVPLRLFLFLCWFPSVAGFPFFSVLLSLEPARDIYAMEPRVVDGLESGQGYFRTIGDSKPYRDSNSSNRVQC
jgi:hypothetical protein